MVPFEILTSFELGPWSVDVFGTCVALAVVLGVLAARRRCISVGLDVGVGERMACFGVLVGLTLSHVVDVLAYHPDWLRDDPLVLLRIWGSHSSLAGMIGGVLAVAIYRERGVSLDARARLAYVDAYTYAFPLSWVFGRLGCTLVIDHPGRITDAPFATSLATPEARTFLRSVYAAAGRASELPSDAVLARIGFHNLGFYELVYTLLVIAPATIALGRTRRQPGFGIASFFLVYAPVRFAADFLRVGDRTYAGLTFAQYAALALSLGSAWVAWRTRHAIGDLPVSSGCCCP